MSAASSAAIQSTARRYRGTSRFGQAYVAGKVRLDPIYQAVPALPDPHFGDVIDLGCGRGQFGIFLLEFGAARSVLAIDGQRSLLADARHAGRGLRFRTECRNLEQPQDLPQADTVFLIDVLYQLATRDQHDVLATAAAAARHRLIIRTGDPGRGWRSAVTRLAERLGHRVWPHAGAVINPQPVDILLETLGRAGFRIGVQPCWRGTPFCNVLIDARR